MPFYFCFSVERVFHAHLQFSKFILRQIVRQFNNNAERLVCMQSLVCAQWIFEAEELVIGFYKTPESGQTEVSVWQLQGVLWDLRQCIFEIYH